ncbi:hypothetical protein Tco_0677590 [Tanacetum coccineum]|uniref:Uncharacterized protein n=1 Tax=Tanacetum coccineum TaxID=301880 RepID=A0ABQ4XCM6_9ASTR
MKRETTPSIEIDIFTYEASSCTEFAAFNHLLQIEEDMFTYEVEEGTSFEETMYDEKEMDDVLKRVNHHQAHMTRTSLESHDVSSSKIVKEGSTSSHYACLENGDVFLNKVERTKHRKRHKKEKFIVERHVDKVSEYEEDTNEELDNQDTSYAFQKQDHVEQSSSNKCHKLDPPEATYYYKSDYLDEEYMARHMQIDAKVNSNLEFAIWLEKKFFDPRSINPDTRNALWKTWEERNEIN